MFFVLIRDEKKDIYGKIQKLMQEEGTSLEQLEEELKDKMKKLYLPQPDEKTGIIPQFDGYFDLKEIDLSSHHGCMQLPVLQVSYFHVPYNSYMHYYPHVLCTHPVL